MNLGQEEFELLFQSNRPFLVWFSAKWCVPCKKMDKLAIQEAASDANIPYYFCDNDYTPGYCNIRKFPTFAIFHAKKIQSSIVSSNTQTVCDWIHAQNITKK
jgi:thiol-disulfide isomerase/thioredoxin